MAASLRGVVVGLRRDVQVSRHVMRSDVVYVVRDPISFDSHAFSASDYAILAALNGEQTLEEVFDRLQKLGTCMADHEENFYRFILELHRSGLLSLPISDDKQLYARHERRQQQQRRSQWMAPLFLKIPIWNPDAFLAQTLRYGGMMYTRGAFAVWCMFAIACAVVLAARWGELGAQLPSLLAGEQLLSMWILLAGMKVIHEFGHGYAVRRFGGTVPEMGILLILLTPCAYVDASSSWGFSSRRQRIIVCLGGMYFESWIAGIALLVWAFTDPSALHSLAYQAMVLASATTIAFNLNPLMRYDGYYILSDLLQIPNLRAVANGAVQRILKRVFLGIEVSGRAWSPWMTATLCLYSISAALFRVVTVLGICAVVAIKFFYVGLLAGVFYGGSVVVQLIVRCLGYLWASKETAPVRRRALVLGAVLFIVPLLVIVVPIPRHVRSEGVLEREREQHLTVLETGTLRAAPLPAGTEVRAGEPVMQLSSHDVEDAIDAATAQRDAARIELAIAETVSPTESAIVTPRVVEAEHRLAAAENRRSRLTLRATESGQIAESLGSRDVNRTLQAGMPGAVVVAGGWFATLVIDQHTLAAIRDSGSSTIQIRSVAEPSRVLHGRIHDLAPSGSATFEQQALTVAGGGDIPVSPINGAAENQHFELRLELDSDVDTDVLRRGLRVEASLPGPSESLARRWYRAMLRFNDQLRAAH